MEVLGVPISIWHSLVVEEHTGIMVFILLLLAVRVLADIFSRGKVASPRVLSIHSASDTITYLGSIAVVAFLIVSGITGYLSVPYSSLISQPILIDKSLLALGSLYFWAAFFFLRYWFGPGLWKRAGLYAVYVLTALLGFLFTMLTASIGAELAVGESALEPVYSALSFSWSTFTLQPADIEITLALVVIGVVVALIALFRAPKSKTTPSMSP
jgi:hypothetical protein